MNIKEKKKNFIKILPNNAISPSTNRSKRWNVLGRNLKQVPIHIVLNIPTLMSDNSPDVIVTWTRTRFSRHFFFLSIISKTFDSENPRSEVGLCEIRRHQKNRPLNPEELLLKFDGVYQRVFFFLSALYPTWKILSFFFSRNEMFVRKFQLEIKWTFSECVLTLHKTQCEKLK